MYFLLKWDAAAHILSTGALINVVMPTFLDKSTAHTDAPKIVTTEYFK